MAEQMSFSGGISEERSTGQRSSLDRVVEAAHRAGLKVSTPRPHEAFISCPLHEDRTPSLHATWQAGRSGGGLTVLYCFACGGRSSAADLVDALGLKMADLYDEPLKAADFGGRRSKSVEHRRAGARRGKLGPLPKRLVIPERPAEPDHNFQVVACYEYCDLEGVTVQQVLRKECECENGRHKTFTQRYVTPGGSFETKKPRGFVPHLYRAPQVFSAIVDGITVWLLEGEKDADRACADGLVATTNPQGATSFPDDLIDTLAGGDIAIVLDRDDAGWARGVDVGPRLQRAGCRVRFFLPRVTSEKADYSDHRDAGYAPEDLTEVRLEEVQTWHAHSAVTTAAERIRRDIAEVHARIELAADEDQDQQLKLAKRWAHEVEIGYEKLSEAVRTVHVAAHQAGTAWAAQAVVSADEHLERVRVPVVEALRAAGLPVKQSLSPQLRSEPSQPAGIGREKRTADDSWFDEDVVAESSSFRISNGEIVQWTPTRSRGAIDEEDDGEKGQYKALLSMVVKLTAREYIAEEQVTGHNEEKIPLEGRGDQGPARRVIQPRRLVAVRLAYRDPSSREVVEMRVPVDEWRTHTWLEALPGAPDYDHRKSGLDTLQRAIIAVSPECVDETLYQSTGWLEREDGSWGYVHHRGMITASGHEYVPTRLGHGISRYDFPDPTRDGTQLREAFWGHSASMLEMMPDRVAAPLVGGVFRAMIGFNPWSMVLVGSPASFKTSVASKMMHHFGELWGRNQAISSMSGRGDTSNALRLKLHHAKDALVWLDDFAPTDGYDKAQRNLSEFLRNIHNQEGKSRLSRDGQELKDPTPPRASGLMTSEIMPPAGGSGGQRGLMIPLEPGDVDTERLFPLENPQSRHARALLGASFISWLAGRYAHLREHYASVEADYNSKLSGTAWKTRQTQPLASYWAGWVAYSDFLLDVDAITVAERNALLNRVDAALVEAGERAADPDRAHTLGQKVCELLRHALRQGVAYLDDARTGDRPPWPLARQLGWTRTVLDESDYGQKVRFDRGRVSLGYVLHDPDDNDRRGRVIICDPAQLEAVLKAAAATQAESTMLDRATAMQALDEEGLLFGAQEGGVRRRTIKIRIPCEGSNPRKVVLRLDPIIGDPDDDDLSVDEDSGGPHSSDGWGNPLLPSAPAADQADDEVDEDSQEETVPAEPITLRDAGGLEGVTQPERVNDVGRCAACGQQCSSWISGQCVHAACWMRTTAGQRATGDSSPSPASSPAETARVPSGVGASATIQGAFTALAAVVDVDGIWLSNGERQDLPRLPQSLADLALLGRHLNLGYVGRGKRVESGQLWITRPIAEAIGLDLQAFDASLAETSSEEPVDPIAAIGELSGEVVTAAKEAGFHVGGGGDRMSAWTRIWREGDDQKSLFVVLLPVLERQGNVTAILADNPAPPTLARRLRLFADALEFPYQMAPSTTGLNLMKRARRRDDVERMFQVRELPSPATLAIEADPDWSRKPTEAEAEHGFVVAYDRGGSYLAGVAGLELGIGAFEHHPEGRDFDRKLPGYWKIEVPPLGDWRMPNPLDPRGKTVGQERWVTTPSLDFAVDKLGLEPEILEAFVWPEHGRVLDPWYERIRDARSALDIDDPDAQAARDTLKGVYTSAWGMLGSRRWAEGRDTYAPDWHHLIRAKARTNLLRKIHTIGERSGRWPVAVRTDAIVYTSPSDDPVEAWPGEAKDLGRGLGKYKPLAVLPLEEHLKFLGTTPSYRGLAAFGEED